jgi:hypothetical protein
MKSARQRMRIQVVKAAQKVDEEKGAVFVSLCHL